MACIGGAFSVLHTCEGTRWSDPTLHHVVVGVTGGAARGQGQRTKMQLVPAGHPWVLITHGRRRRRVPMGPHYPWDRRLVLEIGRAGDYELTVRCAAL